VIGIIIAMFSARTWQRFTAGLPSYQERRDV